MIKLERENGKYLQLASFIGGGLAGLTVDMVLFPLDTLKTRLQAEQGFKKAGGFKGIYKGIGPQAIGSAPQAALFFLTYESIKYCSKGVVPENAMPLVHMFGGGFSEIVSIRFLGVGLYPGTKTFHRFIKLCVYLQRYVDNKIACLVRVPMEVVKQRRQTQSNNKSSWKIAASAYRHEGIKGLYRGFGSTILREIPFSIVQFPILEFLKKSYRRDYKNNIPLESWEVAVCGSIAGGVSAAVTTPLDVAKTRIMLADRKKIRTGEMTVRNVLTDIYRTEGFGGLFAGFAPRVMWITLGGYIFFGSYDYCRNLCFIILEED